MLKRCKTTLGKIAGFLMERNTGYYYSGAGWVFPELDELDNSGEGN
jgi:hypothetical protein